MTSSDSKASAYEQALANLTGNDFQDEVCRRLRSQFPDFQRVPPKPNGDGGLDGLSHNQERAYCCYGPESSSASLKTRDLKDDIVRKFRDDLRRLFELKAHGRGKLRHAANLQLADILADGRRIKHVRLVSSWFESHRVIGPLQTEFDRLKRSSELGFIDQEATLSIWGPKDLAALGAVDEHTLFRIEHKELIERVASATGVHIPSAKVEDFEAKFDHLRTLHPSRKAKVNEIAADMRRAWEKAIALDNALSTSSVALHETLERARRGAASTARLRSMDAATPYGLIESMQRDVVERLGNDFESGFGPMMDDIATGVVASLIGECPLDWRDDSVAP